MLLLDVKLNRKMLFNIEDPILLYYCICGVLIAVFLSEVALAIAAGNSLTVFWNSHLSTLPNWNAYNAYIYLTLGRYVVWSFYLLLAFLFNTVCLGLFTRVLSKKAKQDRLARGNTENDDTNKRSDVRMLIIKVCCLRCRCSSKFD